MKAARQAKTAPPQVTSLRNARQKHQESLKNRVLAAAIMIAEGGMEALSMRRLAHALDCAPMTLYSFFESKHALLLALARPSFDTLAVRLKSNTGGPPLTTLRKLFLVYGQFGLERRDEYRTMFMTPEVLPPAGKKPALILAENNAFAAGFDRAQACVSAGLLTGDAYAITTLLWTAVHGAVAAILTFPAFPFGDSQESLSSTIEITIAGLRTNPIKPLLYQTNSDPVASVAP